MKKFLSSFVLAASIIIGVNTSANADDSQEIANKMLGNIASANSAKDVFDVFKASSYGQISGDFEMYLFDLLKQSDANQIETIFKSNSNNKIYKDDKYRNTLFELISLMKEMNILDKEMIELAKEKIKSSTHNSVPQYEAFT